MEFVLQYVLEMLALLVVLIGAIWGLIKYFQAQLEAQRKETAAEVATLHARINDVKEKYVHQDHLDDILGAIRESVGNVVTEARRTNERLDNLFNHLISEAKK